MELDTSNPARPLIELGITSSETLSLVSRVSKPVAQSPCVVLREIPDDNSCLFNAISYVLEGRAVKAPQLRRGTVHVYAPWSFPSCDFSGRRVHSGPST